MGKLMTEQRIKLIEIYFEHQRCIVLTQSIEATDSAREIIQLLRQIFGERIISRNALVDY